MDEARRGARLGGAEIKQDARMMVMGLMGLRFGE